MHGEDAFEDRAVAELVEMGEDLFGLALHLVGHPLDVVRAAERVGDERDAGLVGDHLLRAQRDPRRLLGRQRQRFVERVGVQALRAAEHAGQRLDRDAGDVELGLLRGERHARGLRVEPQLHRALGLGAVALFHPARPDATGGAELADLFEEVDVGVEEERQPRRELVDVETGRPWPTRRRRTRWRA